MKQYVICKACGYIMEASKLGELCPACGVPAKAFEPYTEKLSEKRKRILDLHIHPIVVHLPQAIVPMLIVLAAAMLLLVEGRVRTALLDTTRVLSTFLPFSVVLAFAAGIYDGNLRFHKVTTPLLIRKIFVGSFFFAASLAAGFLALYTDLDGLAMAAFAFLQVFSLGAAVVLGMAGFGLLFSRFPG